MPETTLREDGSSGRIRSPGLRGVFLDFLERNLTNAACNPRRLSVSIRIGGDNSGPEKGRRRKGKKLEHHSVRIRVQTFFPLISSIFNSLVPLSIIVERSLEVLQSFRDSFEMLPRDKIPDGGSQILQISASWRFFQISFRIGDELILLQERNAVFITARSRIDVEKKHETHEEHRLE